MSGPDARRPRRIIVAPPQPAAVPAAARQADRFQRLLNGRRPEPVAERALPAARRARVGSVQLAGPADVHDAELPGPRGDDPALDGQGGEGAAAGDLATPETSMADVRDERLDIAQPNAATGAGPQAQATDPPDASHASAADDRWTGDLVRAVVTLCARTDPSMQAWSVVLPMDPRRLPSTQLHLSLSSHQVLLRFVTQSPHAVHLLSLHRPALATLLAQAIPGHREVDIEIT